MSARTFVVTVSESPARIVVEDVRSRRRSAAGDLDLVGREIARLLDASPPAGPPPEGRRERTVSAET